MINIGIIGVGKWGRNLLRNFIDLPGVNVKVVCDLKPENLRYVREKWPEIKCSTDYLEVVKDRVVDAVVIATPVSSHYGIGLAALRAGKHILVEKALTRTSAETARLIDIAEKFNLVFAAGHIMIYHPAIIEMERLIAKRRLGRLFFADSIRSNPPPPEVDVDVIWDLAVHDISVVLHLWKKEPISVLAVGRRFAHPDLIDYATVCLEFTDGSFTIHQVSWLSAEKIRRLQVAGARGFLRFDETVNGSRLKFFKHNLIPGFGNRDRFFSKSKRDVIIDLPDEEPLMNECRAFINAIKGNGSVSADGRQGLMVMKVLEATQRSILKEKRIKL